MKYITFTPEQQQYFDNWVAERPPFIRTMIQRCPPDRLYRLKAGQRAIITSYEEDGTVTVSITGEFNKCAFERNVFGIKIQDLEECDLPGPEEELGAVLTKPEEIEEFINAVLPIILSPERN